MSEVDGALLAYRDQPSNWSFDGAYRYVSSWLRVTSSAIVRGYPALDPQFDVADVCSEGTVALFHAARRYVYFCGECGRSFVHGGDLEQHGVRAHRRRGCAGVLPISRFAQESARLAMRRTANRLVTPYDLDDELEVSVDPRAAERLEVVTGLLRSDVDMVGDLYGRLQRQLAGVERTVREQVVAYLLEEVEVHVDLDSRERLAC